MKRADLVLGTEYLFDRSNDWQEYAYSSQRVRVIDTSKWDQPYRSYSADTHSVTLTDGSVVEVPNNYLRGRGRFLLVEVLDSETGEHMHYRLVLAAQIRETWAKGREVQVKNRERKAASMAEQRARQQEIDQRLQAVLDGLGGLGFNASNASVARAPRIAFDINEAERLLETLRNLAEDGALEETHA